MLGLSRATVPSGAVLERLDDLVADVTDDQLLDGVTSAINDSTTSSDSGLASPLRRRMHGA